MRANLEEKLKKDLAALQRDTILSHSVDEIVAEFVGRYAMDVPALDRKGIAEMPREDIQMEVPRISQDRVFSGPGPFYVPATLFTLRIPFTGDRNLLRFPPSGFGDYIPAELGEKAILLTYRAEQPDPQAIQREFDGQIAAIELGLEFVRGSATDWNNRLPSLIRPQVEKRHNQTHRNHAIDLGYAKAPAILAVSSETPSRPHVGKYDFFLSHAWEDKDKFARPLYQALTAAGASVWFDEAVLKLGDSLRRKIDDGLAHCHYGIVVISPSFLSKEWPQRELDGLVALEVQSGKTKVLPIWHEIDRDALVQRSPVLADRVAGKSSDGITALVAKILAVLSNN